MVFSTFEFFVCKKIVSIPVVDLANFSIQFSNAFLPMSVVFYKKGFGSYSYLRIE